METPLSFRQQISSWTEVPSLMTCSTSGYLTKNIWLIYIIFVLTGIDNNTASGSKFIKCKTMCGFSGTPYISHIRSAASSKGVYWHMWNVHWLATCGWTHPQLRDRACSAVRGQPMNVWWAYTSFYTASTANRGMRPMIGSPCQMNLFHTSGRNRLNASTVDNFMMLINGPRLAACNGILQSILFLG